MRRSSTGARERGLPVRDGLSSVAGSATARAKAASAGRLLADHRVDTPEPRLGPAPTTAADPRRLRYNRAHLAPGFAGERCSVKRGTHAPLREPGSGRRVVSIPRGVEGPVQVRGGTTGPAAEVTIPGRSELEELLE